MKDHKWFRCFFGLHSYEIYKEEVISDRSIIIGKVIISRCSTCGKITLKVVNLSNINN